MSKKNKFIEYIPNFCDGLEPSEFEFDTVEELLNHPKIKGWHKDYPHGKFHRFSISENHLMLERDGGKKWYVLGFIKHPELVELPKWEPKVENPELLNNNENNNNDSEYSTSEKSER